MPKIISILAIALFLVGCGLGSNTTNPGSGPSTQGGGGAAAVNFTGSWNATNVTHQESGNTTNCSAYSINITHTAAVFIVAARTLICPGILLNEPQFTYQISGSDLLFNGTSVGTIGANYVHVDDTNGGNHFTFSIDPGGQAFVLTESYIDMIYLHAGISK